MPKIKTPHRISGAQHAANKRSLRELRRQLSALRVEAREIHTRNRAQWEAEKQEAAAALKWARALPKVERDYYIKGRLRGEPVGSCVLRHRQHWRDFCRIIRETLDKCIAANRAARAAPSDGSPQGRVNQVR